MTDETRIQELTADVGSIVRLMEQIDMTWELGGGGWTGPTAAALYRVMQCPNGLRCQALRIPSGTSLHEAVSERARDAQAAPPEDFARLYPYPALSHILFAETPVTCTPEEREELRAWSESGSVGKRPSVPRVRVLLSLVDGELLILQRVRRHESSFRDEADDRGTIAGLKRIRDALGLLDDVVAGRSTLEMAS